MGTAQLKANAVTLAKIKNGDLSGADLKDGTLAGTELTDGSVTGAELRDGSVTGDDLADGSVGLADLAPSVAPLPTITVAREVTDTNGSIDVLPTTNYALELDCDADTNTASLLLRNADGLGGLEILGTVPPAPTRRSRRPSGSTPTPKWTSAPSGSSRHLAVDRRARS